MVKKSEITFAMTEAKRVWPIRHQILRPTQSYEHSIFPNDEAATTVHFGAFLDGQIMGCMSLFEENADELPYSRQWRMRGLAVLPNLQGQGIGSRLVKCCIDCADERQGSLLWGRVRDTSFGIFQRYEYVTIGKPFELLRPGISGDVHIQVQFVYKPLTNFLNNFYG